MSEKFRIRSLWKRIRPHEGMYKSLVVEIDDSHEYEQAGSTIFHVY